MTQKEKSRPQRQAAHPELICRAGVVGLQLAAAWQVGWVHSAAMCESGAGFAILLNGRKEEKGSYTNENECHYRQ